MKESCVEVMKHDVSEERTSVRFLGSVYVRSLCRRGFSPGSSQLVALMWPRGEVVIHPGRTLTFSRQQLGSTPMKPRNHSMKE